MGFSFSNFLQICVFSLGIITLFWLSFLYIISNHVRYVRFTTTLSLLSKKKSSKPYQFFPVFLPLLMLVLLSVMEDDQILPLISTNSNFGRLIDLLLQFSQILSRTIFTTLYIFFIAITPITCMLSLFVFQIWMCSFKKNVPYWVPMLFDVK